MRKLSRLGTGALVVSATVLIAAGGGRADGPPPTAPVTSMRGHDWTGGYVGVHAGAGWGTSSSDAFTGTGVFITSTDANLSGPLFGLQWGRNWMVGRNVLLGLESDFSGAIIDSDSTNCTDIPGIAVGCAESRSRTKWISTTRGRLGYAQSHWMIYATGGIAWRGAETTRKVTAAQPQFAALVGQTDSDSDVDRGWVVGGGVEWALARNWSLKLEYQHLQFDDSKRSFTYPGFAFATRHVESDVSIDTVRFGINFRWDRERYERLK